MKLKSFFLFCSLSVLLIACKKKSDTPASSLVGTWKFVSVVGATTVSSSFTLFGDVTKVESVLNFTSSNPKGIYKISETVFTGEAVGYTYTGNATIKQYENNVLLSQTTNAVNSTIPPTNTASTYKKIGSDSLYFEGNAPGTQTGMTATPGGCKYRIEGTKLSLFLNTSTSNTTNQGGILTTDTQKAVATVILEKQ